MPYTLLFTYQGELLATDSRDYLTAIVSARQLIMAGATEVSILAPSGKIAASHHDIIQERALLERIAFLTR